MFEPISDNTAFSRKIVTQITDAIVRGNLGPGDRLPTERELAEKFSVSRTTVRDAVKLLAGQGILNVRHGVGIFVSESQNLYAQVNGALTEKFATIQDLFEIRKILESEAAYWAAERATEQQIQRLEAILAEAKANADDLESLGDHDAEFHVCLAEASHNLVLVRLLLTMVDLLSESRMESLQIQGRPQKSLQDHQMVVDAIKERNAILAKQRMLEHLQNVEDSIRHNIQG